MARKPSVILTPTEKKAAAGAAKESVKAAKAALAEISTKRKQLDKEYAAAVKDYDKAATVAKRTLSAAEEAFFKLSPPKAVASPVS